MSSKLTLYDLTSVSDYTGFESLCNDVMSREGYKSIQPLGGTKDKGRDALHINRQDNVRTIFAYSVRQDWEDKLKSDLAKVRQHGHACDRFVFVTSAKVSPSQYDYYSEIVRCTYDWEFDLFDLDRLATLLDNHYQDLISRHSNIFYISSRIGSGADGNQFSPIRIAEYSLGEYERWLHEYTPLLADHREVDTVVGHFGRSDVSDELAVTEIPEQNEVSIVLGESGAGKTTSLWQICSNYCREILSAQPTKVPIVINMRSWAPTIALERLLSNQLDLLDITSGRIAEELRRGSFVILFDGINEVSSEAFRPCCSTILAFIAKYRANRYVLAIRAADYSENLFHFAEANPPLAAPNIYEIRRLSRVQVEQYVNAYFSRHGEGSTDFRTKLNMDSAEAWESSDRSVQLARIPLFLQVFLDVYRKTQQLPESRAELLQALINHIYEREESRGGGFSDHVVGDRLLGSLAIRSASTGSELTLSTGIARQQLAKSLAGLKAESFVSTDATVTDVWRRILSSNLLKEAGERSVAWLHQLIRDCFLGFEYARMWTDGDKQGVIAAIQNSGLRIDMTYAMTLFALSESQAAEILWLLIRSYDGNGKSAFESQSPVSRIRIAEELIVRFLQERDYETRNFLTLAHDLPYRQVAEAIDSQFYAADDRRLRALLIEALAEMVIHHYPTLSNENTPSLWGSVSPNHSARIEYTKESIKRSVELLRKYLRNTDDLVSFYAAKGLYEHERSLSVERLAELAKSSDSAVSSRVGDLVDEWGLS